MQLSEKPLCLPKSVGKTSDNIRISIITSIENYVNSPHYESLEFSTSLSSKDRAFVRLISEHVGLKHSTFGNKNNRQIIVQKRPPSTHLEGSQLTLSWDSRRSIIHLLQSNPLSSKELEFLRPYQEDLFSTGSSLEGQKCITGRLMGAVPQIPVAPYLSSRLPAACSFKNPKPTVRIRANELPIRIHKSEIFRTIANEQVVIVAGPHGCGKSTQMPQMLLEECYHRAQHCRAICTQPRRLVAHANADRVAAERGEMVGQSIGYQIHLESKVSPKTLLTFCTHAVLLRTIYGDPTFLNSTTHIIVDEIEEEDVFSRTISNDGNIKQRFISNDVSSQTCNLLLGILHRILPKYPHLKVILLVNLKSTSVILCQSATAGLNLTRLEVSTPGALENVNWRTLTQEANSTMLADLSAIRNEEQEPVLQVIVPKLFPKAGDHETNVHSFLLAPQYKKAPVIWIPTATRRPEVYFLEDILQWLDVQSSEMELTRRLLEKVKSFL
nr:unnamed protein product [Spirometra erinaceieuropaei]